MRKNIPATWCFLSIFRRWVLKNYNSYFFPCLRFTLCLLGIFYLNPYHTSEAPKFLGPAGTVTMKIVYLKFTSLRPLRTQKLGPRKTEMVPNETFPGGKAQTQEMGKKLGPIQVIIIEYRVFKISKKGPNCWKTKWPRFRKETYSLSI